MKMKMLVLAVMALGVSACASDPVERVRQDTVERQEAKKEQKQERIDSLPDWVITPPKSGLSSGFFAVGTGKSDNMDMSMSQSTLKAEFGLAKQFRQEISGQERSYARQSGHGATVSDMEVLIDKLVDQVVITGHTLVDREVQLHDGNYIVYSLFHLPPDAIGRIAQQSQQVTHDQQVQDAFMRLEQRLEKRATRRDNARKPGGAEQEERNRDKEMGEVQQGESGKARAESSAQVAVSTDR